MPGTSLALLAGLGFVPTAFSASLIASHYTGKLYSLSFNPSSGSNALAITGQVTGCGSLPAWLELYPADNTVYCFDESWYGSGTMASFSVASDGKLTLKNQAKTSGNDVHGVLYGGSDGKGFAASAQ